MKRRQFARAATAAGLLGLAGCAGPTRVAGSARPQAVVVGGGFGGATAAKYLRLFSDQRIDVTLIEPEARFVSCPVSNLVLGGTRSLPELTRPYDTLSAKHGVRILRGRAAAVDAERRTVTLASGDRLPYDKLLLSPGVDLLWDAVEGLASAHDSGRVLQAWKAGAETLALRRQLEAMPDGGVFAITIPEVPYRCPPGPYERACQVASYFKRSKPRAKVLILDANGDVTSKGPLFKRAWAELYPGMVEYRPQHKAVGVDGPSGTLRFEVQDDVRADVINLLPPMRAGAIALAAGLTDASLRWCHVDYRSFESAQVKDVHVIGDAIQVAPLMPKSGHMANAQAKVAAAAIVAELSGLEVDPEPMLTNTCYSFVDASRAVHIASVHRYVAEERTYKPVAGAGGVSTDANELEGRYAWDWARNIWADMLD